MAGRVHIEKKDGIGWIVFDHPERRNAMTARMWSELVDGARSLDADDDVRVIVMRGAGETAFVSGADISQFQPAAGEGALGARGERIDPSQADVFEVLEGLDTQPPRRVSRACPTSSSRPTSRDRQWNPMCACRP